MGRESVCECLLEDVEGGEVVPASKGLDEEGDGLGDNGGDGRRHCVSYENMKEWTVDLI